MTFCFVLIGESFRLGYQGSRDVGRPHAYRGQMLASQSHLEFIKYMQDTRNLTCDVILNTISTPYDDDLRHIYAPLRATFHKTFPSPDENSLSVVTLPDKQYDFIFYLRLDLYLKPDFKTVFPVDYSKIYFPCICYTKGNAHIQDACCPRVNDTMCIMPTLIPGFRLCHAAWSHLVHIHHIPQHAIATLLATYHDSDSSKDWNPLYRMIGRPETKNWFSKNLIPKNDHLHTGQPSSRAKVLPSASHQTPR